MTPLEIQRRRNALKADRNNVEGLWDLIEQFVLPFRGEFYRKVNSENSVDWRKRQIYDSTAPVAAQNLAAAIQSNMMNPATRWFDMYFPDPELQKDDDAREWIEACADIIYDGLNESDFNKEASESILDMVGFGTTVIVEEVQDERNDPKLDFSHSPLKGCLFEQDSEGGLLNFYRDIQYTALQIRDKWYSESLEGMPQKVKDKLNSNKAGIDKFDIIFCIYNRFNNADKTQRVLAPTARQYGSTYILVDDGGDNPEPQVLGEEGGYYEMPAFAPRFRRTSDSIWGHGPAAVAMADILTLNELVEMVLENAAKAIDPPTMTTKRGLLSNLNLGRGQLTVVKSLDEVKEFLTGARFDVAALEVERLQNNIKDCFYVNQLELKDTPAMTATEAHIRYELMQRLLGPTSSSFQTDWLNPCIERTFNIYYRAGKLPEMPPIVADMQGQYRIEYTGPMARSHKRELALAINNWTMSLAEMGQVLPDVLDVPDPDNLAIKLGIMQGVPADVMRSETEIVKERDRRRAAIAAQQSAEVDLTTAKARSVNAQAENAEAETIQ